MFVIEDGAQSFGGLYQGKKLGSFGDCGCFSFYPTKNLSGYGDAGLVATNSKALKERIRILRNHGQRKTYYSDYLGVNSRLDSIQAAVLLAKLKQINTLNSLRRKAAKKYAESLKGIKEIKTPLEPKGSRHVYHLYTLKVALRRDQLLGYLNKCGIQARLYYPFSLNRMPAFRQAKVKGPLANTKDALGKVISLPLHPFLKRDELDYVIKRIFRFFNSL